LNTKNPKRLDSIAARTMLPGFFFVVSMMKLLRRTRWKIWREVHSLTSFANFKSSKITRRPNAFRSEIRNRI